MSIYQDETQLENHLERSTSLPVPAAPPNAEGQRKRMLIALGILLVALAAVILKDWDFWFPPSVEVQEARVHKSSMAKPVAPAEPAMPTREHKTAAKPAAPPVEDAPLKATTTERAVLPPLEVEVVAGNRRMNVPAQSGAIHLDVGSGATAPAAGVSSSALAAVPSPNPILSAHDSAHDRPEVSPQTNVSVSVPPDYPLLARQMKVQGVVSLQALISREGTIQELQILSGPAILAAAAREAVKQWRFKPYMLNGQAVETQARIKVNFTISTN